MLHQHMLGPSTSLSGNNNSTLQSSVLSDGALLSHSQPTREELKKSFETREGIYRNVSPAEITRPRPLAQYHMSAGMASAAANQIAASGATVRVSFLNLAAKLDVSANPPPVSASTATTSSAHDPFKKEPNGRYEQEVDDEWSDKICFNVGKELYVYSYRGTHTEADLSRPIDKRVYKGTSPTYHAFNQDTATPSSCSLIIGFSLGQLQIIDPLEKASSAPLSKLYNEDRFIEKTAVTCIRWLPGEKNIFLASYVSGNVYIYDTNIPPVNMGNGNNSTATPPWLLQKEGEKFAIYNWKPRSQPRNPICRWQIGDGAIHQFNFSGPDAKMMATVGHDGFLRIFNYHSQDLVAMMKSYFGGLLSLSWSPDAKFIATGGEDDLLTLYSVLEKKVVCRGQGHKSWVSQVQFDPFLCPVEEEAEGVVINGIASTTTLDDVSRDVTMRAGPVPSTSADLNSGIAHATSTFSRCSLASFNTIGGPPGNRVLYRIGSVGHDTFLCLWDITTDMLNQENVRRHRNSTIIAPIAHLEIQTGPLGGRLEDLQEVSPGGVGQTSSDGAQASSPTNGAPRPEKKKKRFAKRAFNFTKFGSSNNSSSNSNSTHKAMNGSAGSGEGSKKANPSLIAQISCCQETRMLGSKICPGIRDVPIIEPLLCKKVSHDRLTTLEFREDCVVTACQEGYICTWGRPGKYHPPKRDCINSPGTATPEVGQKPSTSGPNGSYVYGPDISNGVPPSRSSSTYSNPFR